MGEVAMWSAISAIGVALVTGFWAFMEKNRRQDRAISNLELDHRRCEEDRRTLSEALAVEWPSEYDDVMAVMRAMKANGMPVTMAAVSKVIEAHHRRHGS